MSKNKSAFSLIELSIVILVIALLISGFVGAAKLIENSKIQRLVKEITNVSTAYQSFNIIYSEPPGDFSNADTFFDSLYSSSTYISSGDGDGFIETGEDTQSVRHLQAANLITAINSANTHIMFDSFDGAGLFLYSFGDTGYGYALDSNLLQIGDNSNINNPFLIPYQADQVDEKIDDGQAQTGRMAYQTAGSVTDATCANGTDYNLSSTTVGCNIIWGVD